MTTAVRDAYAPMLSAAAGARQELAKAKEVRKAAMGLRDRLQPVMEALGPLNKEMQDKAAQIIKTMGEKLLAEQREAQRQKLAERQRSKGKDRDGFSL